METNSKRKHKHRTTNGKHRKRNAKSTIETTQANENTKYQTTENHEK